MRPRALPPVWVCIDPKMQVEKAAERVKTG
jgi:hypothetical protein